MTENHHPQVLHDRTIVVVEGADAAHFLQNVITTDMELVSEGTMLPGALLTAQGKILFDFVIGCHNGQFMLDLHTQTADAFVKRLGLYKLRAKVEIYKQKQIAVRIDMHKNGAPVAPFADTQAGKANNLLVFNDNRINKKYNCIRIYDFNDDHQPLAHNRKNWDMIRIENGVAESGTDFELGDVFPHDINYDQINGLSFKKGCYIGQEVISRMQHRGTARKRVLVATGTSHLPPAGTSIEADGKRIGTLGTVIGTKGIALVRIDRVRAAMEAGSAITANAVPLSFAIPANAHFSLADTAGGE